MTTINNLPAEIICEIAKYNPASSAKLGLTCKTFNKILEKELKENQKVFNHNKKIYKSLDVIEYRRNEIANKFLAVPYWITQREYNYIMKNLDDDEEKLVMERKCINCKRMSKDMSKIMINLTFYTQNICNDCAHVCFNVKPITVNKMDLEENDKGKNDKGKKGKGKKKRNTNNNNN